jgi:hypothetical protein
MQANYPRRAACHTGSASEPFGQGGFALAFEHGPHDRATTFHLKGAIFYLRNSSDGSTLQRLLGHSNLDMVKGYLAIAPADVASAQRKGEPVNRWTI